MPRQPHAKRAGVATSVDMDIDPRQSRGTGGVMELLRLRTAKDLAVFRNWSSSGECDTDFARYNLVYGFNGTGKTTLSRLFASLEHGAYSDRLPHGGRFEFDLADGSRCGSEAGTDRLKSRVIVFNTDFVEENFKWVEGTATPVFYIGREQAALGEALAQAEAKLVAAQERRDRAEADKGKQETRLAAFKRDTARNIQQQTYSNPYRAPNLDADYQAATFGDEHALDEDRQRELTKTILQDEPPAPVSELDERWGSGNLASLDRRTRTALSVTPGTIALEDLKPHDTMLRWISEGADYHSAHNLKSCLFCSNDLPEGRLDQLRASIDGKFEALMGEVERLAAEVQAEEQRLATALTQLPASTALAPGLGKEYSTRTHAYQAQAKAGLKLLNALAGALTSKLNAPSTTPGDRLPSDTATIASALDAALAEVNEIIRSHNAQRDEFAATQSEARRRLRANLLRLSQAEYRRLTAEQAALKEDYDARQREAEEIASQATALRQQIQQHGPAAAAINDLVRNYLRHSELQIEAVENGFNILRNGRKISGGVSEGEKTAITFCYFLSCISAHGRAARDTILVVDDPISSLDSKAMNYAFNLMRSHATQAKQVFILTHNIHFMNECKKWLKKKDDSRIICIDMQQGTDGTRSSTLISMPRLLLDFDSEYHYLFRFVRDFAISGEAHYDYTYLMPNVMRKVLEVFLTFKVPTHADIVGKLDDLSKDHPELDAIRLRALNRLIQVESHGDSMDDIVAINAMTLEETRDCAAALIDMMKLVDRKHYDGLESVCR